MTLEKLQVIAGPCAAESRDQVIESAQALAGLGITTMRAGAWKPRTHAGGFEGHGAEALKWLAEARQLTGLKMAIEVGTPEHVELSLKHDMDVLWIGARTATNPFAVQEVAQAMRGCSLPVLVKNPLNPDIELWIGAIERLQKAGISDITAVHRGFSVYHPQGVVPEFRNDPYWRIPLELRHRMPDIPIFIDPSHMAGKSELIGPLCNQAVSMSYDGMMIECHCHPDKALSDARQQITPVQLEEILKNLPQYCSVNDNLNANLLSLRSDIDDIDRQIIALLARRMELSSSIGSVKQQHRVPVFQPERYHHLLTSHLDMARAQGLSPEFAKALFSLVHEESCRQQL